jgi:hypothetical protein
MFENFLEVFSWKDAVINGHRNVTSVDDECQLLEQSQCIYLMRIHVSVVDPRAWIDLSQHLRKYLARIRQPTTVAFITDMIFPLGLQLGNQRKHVTSSDTRGGIVLTYSHCPDGPL